MPQRARRVLFHARYEASQLGGLSIGTEHVLLGLLREGKGMAGPRLRARPPLAQNHRQDIEDPTVVRDKALTSVQIPFSVETERVLGLAAEEADRLSHNHIGTEHLLLGLLRSEQSMAGSILMDRELRLDTVREDVVLLHDEKTKVSSGGRPSYGAEAMRVLDSAVEECNRLSHTQIRPEHLLLGPLSDEQSPVAPVLKEHGLDLADAKDGIRRLLDPPGRSGGT